MFERDPHYDSPEPVALRARLEELSTVPPSGESLAELIAIDPQPLSSEEALMLVAAFDRYERLLSARRLEALAVAVGPDPVPCDSKADDWVIEEVAITLGMSPSAASRQTVLARRLTSELPLTLQSMRAGQIGYLHALWLAEKTLVLDDALTTEVERRVLDNVAGQTLGQFRRSVERAIVAVDPASAQERHERTVEYRRVELYMDDDATATIVASGLPTVDAQAVFNALDARARQMGKDDQRTMDQRRVDALIEWGYEKLADPSLPKEHGRRPNIQITIDLPTLLRLADRPAELDGYGPIPPDLARELAGDGVWRRLVTDPTTGHLLDYGPTTYKPPQPLVDFITARDKRCRFPGCVRRARLCDHDHAIPVSQGGTTCAENVCCLCERHHRMKHEAGWKFDLHPDGGVTWITPAGQKYYQPPPPILE